MGTEDPNTSLTYSVLEQNCRDDWPIWTCIFANISGMCSTTLWFIVLLPQVWKNFRRKSVKGLSVLWATANFTASLINLFFVFIYVTIPLYGQISSIYCPILEFALLIQFWIYGRYRKIEKLVYGSVCVLLWGVVIVVELVFKIENFIEYIAILLWCIETFPQVRRIMFYDLVWIFFIHNIKNLIINYFFSSKRIKTEIISFWKLNKYFLFIF